MTTDGPEIEAQKQNIKDCSDLYCIEMVINGYGVNAMMDKDPGGYMASRIALECLARIRQRLEEKKDV
jgi:hypothetical protein